MPWTPLSPVARQLSLMTDSPSQDGESPRSRGDDADDVEEGSRSQNHEEDPPEDEQDRESSAERDDRSPKNSRSEPPKEDRGRKRRRSHSSSSSSSSDSSDGSDSESDRKAESRRDSSSDSDFSLPSDDDFPSQSKPHRVTKKLFIEAGASTLLDEDDMKAAVRLTVNKKLDIYPPFMPESIPIADPFRPIVSQNEKTLDNISKLARLGDSMLAFAEANPDAPVKTVRPRLIALMRGLRYTSARISTNMKGPPFMTKEAARSLKRPKHGDPIIGPTELAALNTDAKVAKAFSESNKRKGSQKKSASRNYHRGQSGKYKSYNPPANKGKGKGKKERN